MILDAKNQGRRSSNQLFFSRQNQYTLWPILAGVAAIAFYSLSFPSSHTTQPAAVTILGTGLVIAGAAFILGAFLGFLFGIPRVLQGEQVVNRDSSQDVKTTAGQKEFPSTSEERSRRSGRFYGANNNLEQVSDWVTKILLGVGLTQLTALPESLNQLADVLGKALGELPGSGVFGAAISIHFLVCGFLSGYLWAKLGLTGQFEEMENDLSQRIENFKDDLQDQLKKDIKARLLIIQQLDRDMPELEREPLRQALEAASDTIKIEAFVQAESMRSATWRDKKAKMARTIPIFEALRELEESPRETPFRETELFHRLYGVLGFSYKDILEPTQKDYEKAKGYLDKAIKKRKEWNYDDNRWTAFYELNHGICLIALEPLHPTVDYIPAILKDLSIVCQAKIISKERLLNEKSNRLMKEWLERNRSNPRIQELAKAFGCWELFEWVDRPPLPAEPS